MADTKKDESPAAPKAGRLRKVRVIKESGLFWLRPKVAKGEEAELPEAQAIQLVRAKHAAPVGWKVTGEGASE